MATERIKTEIVDDTAVIEFLPASGVTGTLTVNADQLLKLIKSLGDVHLEMLKGKPIPPLEGNPPAIFNTRWYIPPLKPLTEWSILSFYHPSFGPVAFAVPHEQVQEMIRLLSLQLEAAQQQPALKPN